MLQRGAAGGAAGTTRDRHANILTRATVKMQALTSSYLSFKRLGVRSGAFQRGFHRVNRHRPTTHVDSMSTMDTLARGEGAASLADAGSVAEAREMKTIPPPTPLTRLGAP